MHQLKAFVPAIAAHLYRARVLSDKHADPHTLEPIYAPATLCKPAVDNV